MAHSTRTGGEVASRGTVLQVSHPAALLHVPRGARKERLDFRALTTPVEVAELPESSFRHVGTLAPRKRFDDPEHELFLGEGALWTRLVGWQDEGLPADQIGARFGPEIFARFLAGERIERLDCWYGSTDLASAFARSPLEARYEVGFDGNPLFRVTDEHTREMSGKTDECRGVPVDPARSRRVALDDEAMARAAVTRFVGERIAFSGDRVMFRLDTPLVAAHCRPGLQDADLYDACVMPYRHWRGVDPALLCRADLLAAHAGSTQPGVEPRQSRRLPVLLSALEGVEQVDGDIEAYANLVPQRMVRIANASLAEHYMEAPRPGTAELLAERSRPFETWAIRGMTGSVPASEAPEIAREVSAFLRLVEEVRPRSDALYDLRRHAAYAEGYLSYRCAHSREDEEAMSFLSAP